jgi:hypothetical protein
MERSFSASVERHMERSLLLALLEAAKKRLAETEAHIRRHLGALVDVTDLAERSETEQQIDALQHQRLKRTLDVEHIQDELDSSGKEDE